MQKQVSIKLSENLKIQEVDILFTKLKEALDKSNKIILNATKLEKIDGANIQLVASFIKKAESLDKKVSWKGLSDVVKNQFSRVGLGWIVEESREG